MAETVPMWKERIKREAAAQFGVKQSSILLIPKYSRRGIRATWQNLGSVQCPSNGKEYRAYWIRTEAEFRKGKRLNA